MTFWDFMRFRWIEAGISVAFAVVLGAVLYGVSWWKERRR